MEGYIYKCPGCGASLEYDIKCKLLVCSSCGKMYSIPEGYTADMADAAGTAGTAGMAGAAGTAGTAGMTDAAGMAGTAGTADMTDAAQDVEVAYTEGAAGSVQEEFMNVNVYHCSSCGSEIMTNDVEISKFCSYCGQPTIMFDRVSSERRPAKIMPFVLTKEEVLRRVKLRFGNAKYLTCSVAEIDIDKIYGVYMPYWIYNSAMALTVQLDTRTEHPIHGIRSAQTRESVTMDASKRLSDYVSAELNPFPVSRLVPFSPAYLTGFYADKNDVDMRDRREDVRQYLHKKLENEILSNALGKSSAQISDIYGERFAKMAYKCEDREENFQVESTEYALLPVYIITFRFNERLINILVNGVTGKMVGAIPVNEPMIKRRRVRDIILHTVIYAGVGAFLFTCMPMLWSAGLLALLCLIMVVQGTKSRKSYYDMIENINSKPMFELADR